MTGTKFDPSQHLSPARKNGPADYLQVRWRVVWLRQEHPDAITSVEHVEISPDIAIFRATVTIPGGGSATDYGSETPRDFGDYIEKAATKALGRALAQVGYGTQFVGADLDDAPRAYGGDERANNPRVVDSPAPQPRAPQRPPPGQPPAFVQPRPAPTAPPAPATSIEGWHEFWSWARPRGYQDRAAIETRIGRVIAGMTPNEVQAAVVAAEH